MTKTIAKIIGIVQRMTLIVRSLTIRHLVLLSPITLILLHSFLAHACDPTPPPQPAQISPPVHLKSSYDLWLETSAGVAHTAADGWKLFVFGSSKGLSAKLTDFSNSPVAPLSDGLLPPSPPNTRYWANDQLTVQLANGDVLLSWNGSSQIYDADLKQNAVWWNKWPTLDSKAPKDKGYSQFREGVRAAELFWRYSAANDTWTASGMLDTAYVGGMDKNSAFQSGYCASGVPWVGGLDRPELYPDPWGVNAGDITKQRLYLSAMCSTVDFNKPLQFDKNGVVVYDDQAQQLFISPDSGVTWQSSKLRLNPGVTPMTASSSGRLFMLQYGASAQGLSVPVVYVSDDQGQTLSPETPWESPVDMSYRNEAKQILAVSVLPASTVGLGPPYVYPLSIAAVGPSAVIVVYPSQEAFYVEGDLTDEGFPKTHLRQVAVVTMLLSPKGQSPSVIPITIIRAKSELGSVVMTGLITDNRAVDNPASLLYWMETTSTPWDPVGVNSITCAWGTPVGVAVRYALFAGPSQFPGPIGTLSDPAGFQRCPPQPPVLPNLPAWSFGDYMKGTSYFDEQAGTVNFVPVWSQEVVPSVNAHLVQPFARIIPVLVAKQETQKSADQNPAPAQPPAPAPRGRPAVRGVNQPSCDFCREGRESKRPPGSIKIPDR